MGKVFFVETNVAVVDDCFTELNVTAGSEDGDNVASSVESGSSRFLYRVSNSERFPTRENLEEFLSSSYPSCDKKIFDLSDINISGIISAGGAEAAKKTIGFMAAATGMTHAFFAEHLEDNPTLIYYIIPVSIAIGFTLVGLPACIMKQFLLASHAFSSLFERSEIRQEYFDVLLNRVFNEFRSLLYCVTPARKMPLIITLATYAELPEDLAMVLSMLAAANLSQERLISAIAIVIFTCCMVRVETSKQFWHSIMETLQALNISTASLQGRDQFLATPFEGSKMLKLINYYQTSNELPESNAFGYPHQLHLATCKEIFKNNKTLLIKCITMLGASVEVNESTTYDDLVQVLKSATNGSGPRQIKARLIAKDVSSDDADVFNAMRYLISEDSLRSRIAYGLFEFWVGGTALASMAMLLPAIGSAAIKALAPELYLQARSQNASGLYYVVGFCLKHNLYLSAVMALPFLIFNKFGFKGFYLLDIVARGRATLIMSAETMLGARRKTCIGKFLYNNFGLNLGPRNANKFTYLFQWPMNRYNKELSIMPADDVEKNIMKNLVFSFVVMLGFSVPNGLITDLSTWRSEEKGFLIQLAVLVACAVVISVFLVPGIASAEFKAWWGVMSESLISEGSSDAGLVVKKVSAPEVDKDDKSKCSALITFFQCCTKERDWRSETHEQLLPCS